MIKTIEPKDIFKNCCLHERPLVYLRALRIYAHNQQLKANIAFVENNTIIKNTCGWCNQIIEEKDFDYLAGYWFPFIFRPVHTYCKKKYKDYEAFECQNIDKNCNDCKFFKRGKIQAPLTQEHDFLAVDFKINWTEERKWEKDNKETLHHLPLARLAKIGDMVEFNGYCEKKNIPVHAQSNFACGYECFEHRKS